MLRNFLDKIGVVTLLSMVFLCCNKKTSVQSVSSSQSQTNINHFSFVLGGFSYTSSDIYGQQYILSNDTILQMNFFNNTDTVSGGFSLHAPLVGSYSHTNITTVSPSNAIVINFGNPSMPASSFYSKSGTINVTKYDNINHEFEGTFSGIMYLNTNPSYTLQLNNGSFYYKLP